MLFYSAGTKIPDHTHSTDTLHVVLAGKLEAHSSVSGEKRIYDAAEKYRCGGWEYRATALEDTYVMLIQAPGTEFIRTKS